MDGGGPFETGAEDSVGDGDGDYGEAADNAPRGASGREAAALSMLRQQQQQQQHLREQRLLRLPDLRNSAMVMRRVDSDRAAAGVVLEFESSVEGSSHGGGGGGDLGEDSAIADPERTRTEQQATGDGEGVFQGERRTQAVVLGALAAAAAAVNVALQSISGVGGVALSPAAADETRGAEQWRSRKRKRRRTEEEEAAAATAIVPAVLSADAAAAALCESTACFFSGDEDWVARPWPARWWRRQFRVSRQTFEYICELVRPDVESEARAAFRAIEGRVMAVEKQVAIALRRLASGDSLAAVGELFGVGESTVSKVVWRFVAAMEKRAGRHLRWPEGEEMRRVKDGFEMGHGLLNCCGAIDASHVVMELPGTEAATEWIDGEQNYSMLMQVVVDSEMRIRDLHTGCPGGATDSRLLRSSALYADCESGKRLSGPPRVAMAGRVREHVVGDTGFPLLGWLLCPYTAVASAGAEVFNRRHASAKAVVEGALGRLKGAWRILHRVLWRPDVRRLPSVIRVCCLLHNILIEAGEELEDGVALVGHHDEGYRQQWCRFVDPEGDRCRDSIGQHIVNRHQRDTLLE